MKTKKAYEVRLHPDLPYWNWNEQGYESLPVTLYTGTSETAMYSHVSTIEYVLMIGRGTAQIEIVEDGAERWIEYREGVREGI